MLKVLMVAEKPSVAEAIAKSLCGSGLDKISSFTMPTWSFESKYLGNPCITYVTSTAGHMYSLDFEPRYNNRNQVDETELFEAGVIKKVENQKVVHHIQSVGKKLNRIDHLVLWLDCDKEGENICYEVIGLLKDFLPKSAGIDDDLDASSHQRQANPKGKRSSGKQDAKRTDSSSDAIRRVKFSSLVPSDLRSAYVNKLSYPNKLEALSVDARQELDLKIGVSFTRFLTRYLSDYHGGTISYGPCQMPTLWFCVQRMHSIDSFKPREYYTIIAEILDNVEVAWAGGRIFDAASAAAIADAMAMKETATVVKSREQVRKQGKPLPFNTMEMLKCASKVLGMAPQRAMIVAEGLYLSGHITYPRTESTKFAPAFDLKRVVDELQRDQSIVRSFARQALHDGISSPQGGVDQGDHPPITPCSAASTFISSDHERLYRLICCRFFQSISAPAEYRDHSIELRISGFTQGFKCKTSTLEKKGFLAYSFSSSPDEFDDYEDFESLEDYLINSSNLQKSQILASLKEGDVMDLKAVTFRSSFTKPPKPLTESELLTKMEQFGIGTDASVTQHIANILTRDYVRLQVGPSGARLMIPTELGTNLCNCLTRIDDELTSPRVRSIIERSCQEVAVGRFGKNEVVNHVLKEFALKFQHFLRSVDKINEIMKLEEKLRDSENLSRCGKCKLYMIFVNKAKLICRKCALTLSVPIRVKVRAAGGDIKCCYDNFEMLVAVEKNDKAWCFCPFCWNYSPATTTASAVGDSLPLKNSGSMASISTASSMSSKFRCLDSNDKLLYGSAYQCSIARCSDRADSTCSGLLYLQNYSGGCKLGLSCSVCDFRLNADVNKVKRIDKQIFPEELCPKCCWSLVHARLTTAIMEQHKVETPSYKGCLGCDEILSQLFTEPVRKKHHRGGGGGGFRGRGRR